MKRKTKSRKKKKKKLNGKLSLIKLHREINRNEQLKQTEGRRPSVIVHKDKSVYRRNLKHKNKENEI